MAGNWSTASTWEMYEDSSWVPAGTSPTGSENITVDDSVNVDAAVNISDYVILSGTGKFEIGIGSLTFGSGSTYEHARNGGTITTSTWDTGSNCLITGAAGNAPGNANQNFYYFTWNCPSQSANLNLAWSSITIGGNFTCINSSVSRFQVY